jgi:hypothetical protein
MRSFVVAVEVFSRWKENSSTLRVFTPQEPGVASSHDAKVISVDERTGTVQISFDDRDVKTWELANAKLEYVDASEDEDTPEELRRDFVGKFLKVEFSPRPMFVIGELCN